MNKTVNRCFIAIRYKKTSGKTEHTIPGGRIKEKPRLIIDFLGGVTRYEIIGIGKCKR